MFRDVRARVPGRRQRGPERPLPRRPRPGGGQLARRHRGRRAAGGVHRERHRRAGRQRGAGGDRHGQPRARPSAGLPLQRRHPRDLPHEPAALLSHRQLPPAQQGDRRPERVRPRGRHPPARHAAERAHLRDHPAGDGRHSALDPGPGQALGPPRAGAPLPRAGLRPDRAAAGRGVPRSSPRWPTASARSWTRTCWPWCTRASTTRPRSTSSATCGWSAAASRPPPRCG